MNIGKFRGLCLSSTPRRTFSILALDHRGNLRRAMKPSSPESVSYSDMVEFKIQVVTTLAPFSSAVLLDPEIGAASSIVSNAMPGNVGILVALEETGYSGSPSARKSKILPEWGVDKVKRMGANGVKLLIYYHPDSAEAQEQEELIYRVAEDCIKMDIPLFLETLSYSLDPNRKKLPSTELRQVVIETTKRLTNLGADVLKAEFPIDISEEPDQQIWSEACKELTNASKIPWTLLSAGVNFDTFLEQIVVACQAGASGVLAGRAVWQEAIVLYGSERMEFLRTIATDRMSKLTCLCDAIGRPFTSGIELPQIDQDWYVKYSDFRL